MKKEELDVKIAGLPKKKREEIQSILDTAGKEAFDKASLEGKSEEEAQQAGLDAALLAGEKYFSELEMQAANKQTPPAQEKKSELIIDWGGYAVLQLESYAKDLRAEIRKVCSKDKKVLVTGFCGAPEEEKKKGKKIKVMVTGDVEGIKRVYV
jgi:aspartokinase